MSENNERTRPKPYHHGDLRNALIEAGQALLNEEGVAALDLRKVARRAGVSHAAPYRHFADKQALLAAIAEDGFKRLTTHILAARQAASKSTEDQLLNMARAYVQFAKESPAHMHAMFSGATGDRAPYPTLYATSKEAFFALVDVVRQGQERGEIAAGNPVEQTLVTWSLIHGFAMLVIERQIPGLLEDEAAVEANIRLCIGTLYKGLACREAL